MTTPPEAKPESGVESTPEAKRAPRHPERSRANKVFLAFALISAFFLLAEHRAHVFGVLPYLLLLACPLLHLFHHGGHGAHRRDDAERRDPK